MPVKSFDKLNDQRLYHAACLLHDTNWKSHPDYRAEVSFETVTRANLGGIDHEGRLAASSLEERGKDKVSFLRNPSRSRTFKIKKREVDTKLSKSSHLARVAALEMYLELNEASLPGKEFFKLPKGLPSLAKFVRKILLDSGASDNFISLMFVHPEERRTIETLPEEFQTAEYVKDHGGIDLVVERKYLNSTIGTLLNVLLKKAEAQAKTGLSNVKVDKSLQSAS